MTRGTGKLAVLLLRHAPLVLFGLVFVAFGLAAPRFFRYESFENILKQASYIGVAAAGMTLVLLTAGIDLSVGSNMYLSAAAAGLLIGRFGLPVPAALGACLLIGLGYGLANGLLVTRLHIIPFVATLGTMVAGRGLGLWLTGSEAVPFPESVKAIGSVQVLGLVPLPVVIFAGVVLAAQGFLRQTACGRQIYAVGNDLEAARKAGIDTQRVRLAAYAACGLLAALAGFISVSRMGIVNAGFGEGDEFDAIAAAVLGGTSLFGGIGSVLPGCVLGAVLIQMVEAGLVFARVDLYLQPLAGAAIIFLAVLLDAARSTQLRKLARRHIRIEEGDA